MVPNRLSESQFWTSRRRALAGRLPEGLRGPPGHHASWPGVVAQHLQLLEKCLRVSLETLAPDNSQAYWGAPTKPSTRIARKPLTPSSAIWRRYLGGSQGREGTKTTQRYHPRSPNFNVGPLVEGGRRNARWCQWQDTQPLILLLDDDVDKVQQEQGLATPGWFPRQANIEIGGAGGSGTGG